MKVLLFGTGDCYQKYKKWFDGFHVAGLLDNNAQKSGMILDGAEVMLPSEGIKKDYDAIYILSVYEREIREQLTGMGVPENKIYHYFDISTQLKPEKKKIVNYGKLSGEETILFLFYDLNYNGASIAFFHMIRVLKDAGKKVVAATMNDGSLRKELSESEVPVVVDVNMQVQTFEDMEWAQKFDLVFCNTLNFYRVISRRNTDIKFIWWLHEPEIFYDGIQREIIQNIDTKNLSVYAAGQAAADAYHRLCPADEVKIFLYGLPDYGIKKKYQAGCRQIITFVVIGNLQPYKAQDTYIDAILLLDPELRKRAKFYVVGGSGQSRYAAELHHKAAEVKEIVFWEEIEHEKIHELLNEADVLVCPSRQDTMPTVVAEAMMHGVACIMSDHIGTVALIKEDEEGIVFACDDAGQLAEKMSRCIRGQYDLGELGAKARKVYERFFSMERLCENVLNEMQLKGDEHRSNV